MSEHNYTYTDENLSLDQASSYNLLLQVEAKSFNYLITHQKQILAWAENCSLEELTNPHQLKDVLTSDYNRIIVGLSSTGFTLMPLSLFDKDRVADIARLLDVHNTEKVYTQTLDAQNAIVYKVDDNLTQAIANVDAESVNHKAKGWITAIANGNPDDSSLYLNLANEKVQFVYFNNGNLRFYNIFSFSNYEELAYYTAFVANELNLDPAHITLILSGDINKTDKYFTYLADFFGTVKLSDLHVLDFPVQLESHKLLTLAALSLCASSEEN